MAKKGFFRSFLSSLSAAVVLFFLIYFFIPSMGMQYLGVSFAMRSGSADSQVQQALDDVVAKMSQNPDFSKEAFAKLETLLQSPTVQQSLKDAAKQGEQVLQNAVQTVTESVK